MNFNEVRTTYPRFRYESYSIRDLGSELVLEYLFSIPGLTTFRPSWRIPKPTGVSVANSAAMEQLVFSLGMVELVSYWKTTCSPQVEILAADLSVDQISWWKKLYFNGLGEFFYLNGIDADQESFLELHPLGLPLPSPLPEPDLAGCLIPVGGGKDSVVTLELLQGQQANNLCYLINERSSSRKCAETAGYRREQILCAKRTLDPNILELNRKGFFNGHTPFSAVVAFSAVLTAFLNGKRYVVLSNEASANDPTLLDSEVNHQYSKSFEFEQDFSYYLEHYIPCGVSYFSLLRPLSELQIAGLFAHYSQYHPIFRSCNRGSKEDIWCNNCPKCLFTCLILLPFLTAEELRYLFGENLLQKESLLSTLEQLTGIQPDKPFECVGSRDEINIAICAGIRRMESVGKPLPFLLEQYKSSDLYDRWIVKRNPYKNSFNSETLLPFRFEALVQEAVKTIKWQESEA